MADITRDRIKSYLPHNNFYRKHIVKPTASDKSPCSYIFFKLLFKDSSSKYSTNKTLPSQGRCFGPLIQGLAMNFSKQHQKYCIFLNVILLLGASIERMYAKFQGNPLRILGDLDVLFKAEKHGDMKTFWLRCTFCYAVKSEQELLQICLT